MVFDENGGRIDNGMLKSRPPGGNVAYVGALTYENLNPIANFAFAPTEIIVHPGDAVTWTNDDGAPHGLAFADGAKGTGQLLPGASFSRTYAGSGTFDYVCAVHPYMAGKVTVRAP